VTASVSERLRLRFTVGARQCTSLAPATCQAQMALASGPMHAITHVRTAAPAAAAAQQGRCGGGGGAIGNKSTCILQDR
jgi:hypothetical protein